MTTTDEETVRGQRQEASVPPRAGSDGLKRSTMIRVAISVLVSGAVATTLILVLWTPLHTKSDVIAYPIFADFNPYKYEYAYYLTVLMFPVGALLIFLGLTRIGPRIGLVTPTPRGRLRPVARPAEADSNLDPEPSVRTYAHLVAATRVAIVGAVLGLEVGIASNDLWPAVLLVAVGYAILVVLGSVALRPISASRGWETSLARANSLGTTLTVAGLSLVSAHTEVRVLSDGAVHHYSWFPAWLGVPLAAALFCWILVSMRRGGRSRAAAIERRAVALIVVPVTLFLLLAHLPGDLGQIGLFEEGQLTTETMLVGHGWLPWRDVVLAHGLLGDVAPTAVGWGLFGNSYWSAFAGASLIFYPVAAVAMYSLLAYLVGKSWPVLVIAALIFVGPWLGAEDPRYILWPLILLAFLALVKRPTRLCAVALGFLIVAQAIVTPEMAASAPIVLVVLAAHDWYWWPPETPWSRAFRRTIWTVAAASVATAVAAIYMASRGALGDVISINVNLLLGHFTEAILPVPTGAPRWRFDVIALIPVAALLVSFAYAAVRLRLRRPFLPADWPMAAVALFVFLYYSVFLARMDTPHAYEPLMVATPLLVYIVYRAISAAERWIRRRVSSRQAGWMIAHPVGIAVLIVFLVYFWGSLRTQVDVAPAAYRPTAPSPPVARVGYASQFDGAAVDDLKTIMNAYLGPHGRMMDLTNEPALFYYFLGRDPSSRWFAPVGLTDTPALQRSVIADLRRSPPKLVVVDDTDTKMYGLEAMDGIPGSVLLYLITRWVLAHYRPLLESHNRTIYALPGVPPVSGLHLHLLQQPTTVGVPFLGQPCNWGYAPTFLSGPGEPPSGAQPIPVRTSVVRESQVTFTGWAGDLKTGEPAREVIATINGRIVARATPDIDRPDVPAAGFPAGFLRSGFQLSIPISANAAAALKVLAIGRDGSVAELGLLNAPAAGGMAKIGSRTVALQPTADTGHVDTEVASGPLVAIQPPAGMTWGDYGWLEVDSPSFGGFEEGAFDLSNRPNTTDAGRVIAFQTLASSPRRYIIPVSSCAQWHGYGSSRLFLMSSPPQDVGGVRVIR